MANRKSSSNNLFSMVSQSLSKGRNKSDDKPPAGKKVPPKPANRQAKKAPAPRQSNKQFRLTEEQIMEYKEAFAVFDKDNDELITIPETLKVMHALGNSITMRQLKGKIIAYTNLNESF